MVAPRSEDIARYIVRRVSGGDKSGWIDFATWYHRATGEANRYAQEIIDDVTICLLTGGLQQYLVRDI